MRRSRLGMTMIALLGAVLTSGCATSSGYGSAHRVEVAKVLQVTQHRTQGSWVPGAAIGGAVGLATGQGHSTESKVIRTVAGAALGGAVNKAFTQGGIKHEVLLATQSGQRIRVEHPSSDLHPGDCVEVQYHGANAAKLYRTSPTQCTTVR